MTNFTKLFLQDTMKFPHLKLAAPCTKVLLLMVLVDLFSLSSGQNCAVPKMVIVNQDGSLTETLDTGQHLKTIKVNNVEGILTVQQKPSNYSNAKFNPDTSELTLEVETPLWVQGQTNKSYIDEEMANCIYVVVKLLCTDGRSKDVTFEIPIIDENTEEPRFENSNYELLTEPCLMEKCNLIFTKDIVVIDEDRDKENAEMTISTDSHHVNVLRIPTAHSLDEWYDYDKENHRMRYGYQMKIKLEIELEKGDISTGPENKHFHIHVHNNKPGKWSVLGGNSVKTTNVCINFTEYEDRKIAPVFASSVYFMNVLDPTKKFKIFPDNISATIPGNSDDSKIVYDLRSRFPSSILKIDPTTGLLRFCETFDIDRYRRLKSSILEFDVVAIRQGKGENGYKNLETLATLIVHFPELDEPEPPPGSTTTTAFPTDVPTYPTRTTEEGGNATQPELPTTEPELPSTSTLPPKQTSSPPIPTTKLPTTTTTEHPRLPPPTRPPDHCTCDCTQFSCRGSHEPRVMTGFSLHADPYYCTKYHQCSKREDDYNQSTISCPAETIFCPNLSECLTVEECLKTSGINMTGPRPQLEKAKGSEITLARQEGYCGNWSCTCFEGIWPGEPGNLCNAANHDDLIEDPNHCDIFHQCQALQDPHHHHFIDIPQRCPKGLIYCHDLRACTYPTDKRCHCNKTFKHCDVYEMGRWENFDIFNKTFKPSFTLSYLVSLFRSHII